MNNENIIYKFRDLSKSVNLLRLASEAFNCSQESCSSVWELFRERLGRIPCCSCYLSRIRLESMANSDNLDIIQKNNRGLWKFSEVPM